MQAKKTDYRQKYDELLEGCLSLIGKKKEDVETFDTKAILDQLTCNAIANYYKCVNPLFMLIVNCATLSAEIEKIKEIGALLNIADEEERDKRLLKLLAQPK